jgi:hypothetical protein
MRNARGQVIPLWIVAILSTFVLMFMALNYGNTLRWQIRAQNAADAAVQAVTSIQTERFNMLTESLYAANVEEYRLRSLLDATLMTANLSGGCAVYAACATDYADLTAAFVRSSSRYTFDAQVLNDVSSLATYSTWLEDAQALLTHLSSGGTCNHQSVTSTTVNPAGGDCAFKYTLLPLGVQHTRGTTSGVGYETPLNPVEFDTLGNCIPSFGKVCDANQVNSENVDFDPVEVEVLTCAQVPPIIPSFGLLQTSNYYAVGRAAATSVMIEEDWFQPGSLYDNARAMNTPFQFTERYTPVEPSLSYDWYAVNFGGNGAQADPTYGVFHAANLAENEMSVRLGWWSAVPMKPFAPATSINLTTMCN